MHESHASQEAENWETHIATLKAEHEKLIEAGLWTRGPADLLSVIGRGRREIYHSRVIAWLLDPIAPHGFGIAFLSSLVAACDPDWQPGDRLASARVQCEVTRQKCRADIVVWTDTFTLIIENKVDAAESEAQCDRIYADFKDEPDARFVLLSPTGRHTNATGEAKGAFRVLSYRTLANLLTELIATGGNGTAAGRLAAKAYLHTLKSTF